MMLLILIFVLNTFSVVEKLYALQKDSSQITIYLVKERWHTGIVIETAGLDTNLWKEADQFRQFNYIDAGWGDEAFYQSNDFEPELAVRALFYPTPSTIRIECFNIPAKEYAALSDFAVELKISFLQLGKIIRHISRTFSRDKNGKAELQLERFNGRVKFYKANGNYHIFNTCNTWIAKVLNEAGFEISDEVIFAEELFKEAICFGSAVKNE
jgi:uncharacterized protein (TIGR02117 family)